MRLFFRLLWPRSRRSLSAWTPLIAGYGHAALRRPAALPAASGGVQDSPVPGGHAEAAGRGPRAAVCRTAGTWLRAGRCCRHRPGRHPQRGLRRAHPVRDHPGCAHTGHHADRRHGRDRPGGGLGNPHPAPRHRPGRRDRLACRDSPSLLSRSKLHRLTARVHLCYPLHMTASESSAHPPVRPSHVSTCALVPSPIPSHSRSFRPHRRCVHVPLCSTSQS